jgi:hypothetical protein
MVHLTGRSALITAMAFTFVFFATRAAAQSQPHEGTGFGLKGGYLYNSLDFDGDEDLFDGRAGWMAGLFFGGNRTGRIGLMGELNVLRKSALCTCNDEQNDLYYLQIPILLRLNVGSRSLSGISVYGIGGPAIDVKIGEKLTSNIISEYEGLDVSLVGGVGIEITRFIIEARGTWGQRSIAKDLSGFTEDITSRTFAVQAGFRFN